MFNLTFNKPAVRSFFLDEGEDESGLGGLRMRVVDGKLQFNPTSKTHGAGIVTVEPRTRGGIKAVIQGVLADKILSSVDSSKSHFFNLVRKKGGPGANWIVATPWEGGKGGPAKFVPHLRIWRQKSERAAPKVAATDGRRRTRKPRVEAAPAAPMRRGRQSASRSAASPMAEAMGPLVIAFLREHPEFLADHPDIMTAKKPGRRKPGRRGAAAKVAEPARKTRARRRSSAEMAAARAAGTAKPKRGGRATSASAVAAPAMVAPSRPKRRKRSDAGIKRGPRAGRAVATGEPALAAASSDEPREDTRRTPVPSDAAAPEGGAVTAPEGTNGDTAAEGPEMEVITDDMSAEEKTEAAWRNAQRQFGQPPKREAEADAAAS